MELIPGGASALAQFSPLRGGQAGAYPRDEPQRNLWLGILDTENAMPKDGTLRPTTIPGTCGDCGHFRAGDSTCRSPDSPLCGQVVWRVAAPACANAYRKVQAAFLNT